jgi:hypothetical protein
MDRNSRVFSRQLKRLKLLGWGELTAIFAQRAATFASYRHTGLFVSPELESLLSALSARKVQPRGKPQEAPIGATLHILSRALQGGGHTRVVERWINYSPASEVHSVLITRGGKPTKRLKTEVEKRNGEIIVQSRVSPLLRRARQILSVSQGYSRIVLHVHMDDILPMLALSNKLNLAEVIHFNHADHRFWVGASLPNRVIEMRTWGKTISERHRSINRSEVVGIPLPEGINSQTVQRQDARVKLGISSTKEVILTAGHPVKYARGASPDFPEVVRELLIGKPERQLIAIGPKASSKNNWSKLFRDFPGQVVLLPYMPKEKFDLYVRAADIGLDSFPMSGGTAVLDMISHGLPTISLRCPTGHFDVIQESDFYCETIESWVAKANQILSGDTLMVQSDLKQLLAETDKKYGPRVWASLLDYPRKQDEKTIFSEPDLDALNNYLIASTPTLAKLFF